MTNTTETKNNIAKEIIFKRYSKDIKEFQIGDIYYDGNTYQECDIRSIYPIPTNLILQIEKDYITEFQIA